MRACPDRGDDCDWHFDGPNFLAAAVDNSQLQGVASRLQLKLLMHGDSRPQFFLVLSGRQRSLNRILDVSRIFAIFIPGYGHEINIYFFVLVRSIAESNSVRADRIINT